MDKEFDVIVFGAGPAGEVLAGRIGERGEKSVAIVGEVPLATLAHAIAPFPTRSEIWLKFLEAYEAEYPKAEIHSRAVAVGS